VSFSPIQVGERVQVISYGPFRGLRGTIQVVDMIDIPGDLHCFYLVALEGAYTREPVWFEYDEVENASTVALQSLSEPGQEVIA
jgi:hypothetical protein